MIAVLAASALAAPTVDVLLVPLTAHTRSVPAHYETLDVFGQPQAQRLEPSAAGLGHRGIAVEIASTPRVVEPHQWLLMTGLRIANPSYERPGYTLSPTAGELSVGAGMRAWFSHWQEPAVDGYGIAFTGFQLSFLSATPLTKLALAPALTTGGGIGIAARRGRLRPRVEGRAELGARWDHLAGRLEEPDGAVTLKWFPGSLSASLLVGLGFGPRTVDASPPAAGG